MRPGRAPLAALAGVLAQMNSSQGDSPRDAALGVLPPGIDALDGAALEQLRTEPGYLGARLRTRALTKRRRIAIVVDQLEELYTLGAPPAERAAFLACVAAAADDATSPLRVLVTMRSDFLDRLTEDRRLGVEATRGLVLLPPMDPAGMREALLRPVEASDHRFEPPGLIDRMVDDLAATPGALPLLQFTAARLWERRDRDRRLLTEDSYEQLGGVAGALAKHADAVLAGMPQAHQPVARAVLQRLVSPERTRSLVSVSELHALHRDRDLVDGIIQHLAAMRLVVIERSAEGADHTAELAHDSLIDRWPQLVRWLDENQDDAAMLARVRSAARDWERSGRAPGLLWTNEVAEDVRAWQQRYQGELAPIERRYLANVLAEADLSRRLRRQMFAAILSLALLVTVGIGWLTWDQSQASHDANTQAATAAEEATRARDATRIAALRSLAGDPTSQLALLREIEDTRTPPPGAVQEAKRLLYASVAPVVLTGDQAVWSAAFSPDGRRIASASSDVRVWSADGRGEPLILHGHGDRIRSVAFSPDGKRIASASDDRTVRVWNADASGEPLILRGHTGAVRSVAFSPDGQRVVSASRDRTVQIWSADGRGDPVVLRGHGDAVESAAFSPDGQRVASGSL
ncbi:MAG TPA: WD40 repeat domain-containing protein, partial [Kofleriaceae bacterium]